MGITAAPGTAASGIPPQGDQASAVLSGIIAAVGPTAPFAFRGPMNVLLWASITTALTTTSGSLAATVGSATGLAAGDAIASVNLPRGTTVGVLAGTNVTLAPAPRTYRGNLNSAGLFTTMSPVDRLLGATATVPSNGQGVVLPANTIVAAIAQQYVPANPNGPGTPGIIQLSNRPTTLPANFIDAALQMALTGNGIVATGADNNASFTGAGITYNGSVQLERSLDGGLTWIVCNVGASGVLAQWSGAAVGPVSFTFGEPEKQCLYRFNCTTLTSVLGGGALNYRISQTGGANESLAIGPLTNG